jgi:peptidoglycan/LPS O-acetylase OafA/YrhL
LLHHLKKIDLLRGVAILLVFLFHCHLFYFDPNGNGNLISSAKFSFKSLLVGFLPSSVGWSGVVLFFIISGFLIHLGFITKPQSFEWKAFFNKRFWRIFPPYWLTLLGLLLSIFLSGQTTRITNVVFHVFTLYNLNDSYIYSYNPSYWSLATEVQLYLLYPVFLFIRKKLGITRCFLLICGLSVLLLLLGLIYNDFGTHYSYRYNPFQLWFIWAAGAFYAELIYAQQRRLLKKMQFPTFLLSYLLLVACSLFQMMEPFAFLASTATCLIFFDWVLHTPKINIDNWPAKLVILTGLCSYSFYLIHQPYLYPMLNLFGAQVASPLRFAAVIPVFFIVLLASYILFKIIEIPSITIGKSFRKR